jgi:hypothetical protein
MPQPSTAEAPSGLKSQRPAVRAGSPGHARSARTSRLGHARAESLQPADARDNPGRAAPSGRGRRAYCRWRLASSVHAVSGVTTGTTRADASAGGAVAGVLAARAELQALGRAGRRFGRGGTLPSTTSPPDRSGSGLGMENRRSAQSRPSRDSVIGSLQ